MPTYALLERSRERTRGRARIDGQGNYITATVYATVYSLTFQASKDLYDFSKLAKPTYSKAWNYIDNPPPKPAWVPLGPAAMPQKDDYPSGAQVPPRVPPSGIPQGVTPTLPLSGRPGSQGVFVPGILPKQLYSTKLGVRRVTVIADPGNALNVWSGYSPLIAADNAFPLAPGAARDYDIDDISQLWLVGENATDQVFFIFEV